jgi:eukaryotic-like serine/threonine-protein kinase
VKARLSGIFISYRRSDNPDATGRIYDRLIAEFGKAQVFKDVDSIPLGMDFRGHLNDIVGGCAVVLAIIGPGWADTRSSAGQRRLEDPDDFVRIELEAALARGIPVVPVLVGNATMPGVSQLPATLAELAYRQSIQVRPDPDFHNDATRLVSALQAVLDPGAPKKPPPPAAKAASGVPLKWMIAFATAMLAAAALAIPALTHLREMPPPETLTDIVTPATDDPASFALSPDGRQIVFVAKGDGARRLWLRSLAKATAVPLAGTEDAASPFWSPDSRSIGFFVPGALRRLDIDGGQPQTLAPVSSFVQAEGAWSTKGVILFPARAAGPFARVAASGGATTVLPLLGKNEDGNRFPRFLPDGQHFLFVGRNSAEGSIYLGSLDETAATLLTSDIRLSTPIAYLPTGWLLWIRASGTLVAQRLDVAKAALIGDAVLLAEGVSGVSASANGAVAYRMSEAQRQLTWVDRSGVVRGAVGPPDGSLRTPRVSPDGRRVVYSRRADGKSDIWLQDEVRTSRITFGSKPSDHAVWSPDGGRLVFLSFEEGTGTGFYQKPTDGAQAHELLLSSKRPQFPTSWSADGRYLLYFEVNSGPGIDLWVLPMTGERKPFALLQSRFGKVWGRFSPDGRWVAYHSNESGKNEIYVRRFVVPGDAAGSTAAQAGQWQVSATGGVFPMWRADGKELFYIDPAGMMMAAPVATTGSTVVPGTPVALFQTNAVGGGGDTSESGRQYDVAPDGRFLINRVLDAVTAPITLIQNWNPDK